MFEDIDKSEVVLDELLVWGKNTEDYDQTLKQVLKRAAKNDLRFNGQKCKQFTGRKLSLWDMYLELMAWDLAPRQNSSRFDYVDSTRQNKPKEIYGYSELPA